MTQFRIQAPTVEEARHYVLNYSRRMAHLKWTAKEDMDFTKEKSYTSKLFYEKGETYYGVIYVSNSRNMEKMQLVIDENGVYIGPITYKEAVGNTCASAVRISYDNVLTDITAYGSHQFLPMAEMGLVKVGDYDWDPCEDIKKIVSLDTIKKNGEQRMCEAYAKLFPGDAITARWPAKSDPTATNGHARLISGPTRVIRFLDGRIDPDASTVTVIEQNGSFNPDTPYRTTWRVDKSYTFSDLLRKGYLPITPKEFAEGKLPDAIIEFDGDVCGDTLFETNRLQGQLSSNYCFFNVKATLIDNNGEKAAELIYAPQSKKVDLSEKEFYTPLSQLPNGQYRLHITAEIGFGSCLCCDKIIEKSI